MSGNIKFQDHCINESLRNTRTRSNINNYNTNDYRNSYNNKRSKFSKKRNVERGNSYKTPQNSKRQKSQCFNQSGSNMSFNEWEFFASTDYKSNLRSQSNLRQKNMSQLPLNNSFLQIDDISEDQNCKSKVVFSSNSNIEKENRKKNKFKGREARGFKTKGRTRFLKNEKISYTIDANAVGTSLDNLNKSISERENASHYICKKNLIFPGITDPLSIKHRGKKTSKVSSFKKSSQSDPLEIVKETEYKLDKLEIQQNEFNFSSNLSPSVNHLANVSPTKEKALTLPCSYKFEHTNPLIKENHNKDSLKQTSQTTTQETHLSVASPSLQCGQKSFKSVSPDRKQRKEDFLRDFFSQTSEMAFSEMPKISVLENSMSSEFGLHGNEKDSEKVLPGNSNDRKSSSTLNKTLSLPFSKKSEAPLQTSLTESIKEEISSSSAQNVNENVSVFDLNASSTLVGSIFNSNDLALVHNDSSMPKSQLFTNSIFHSPNKDNLHSNKVNNSKDEYCFKEDDDFVPNSQALDTLNYIHPNVETLKNLSKKCSSISSDCEFISNCGSGESGGVNSEFLDGYKKLYFFPDNQVTEKVTQDTLVNSDFTSTQYAQVPQKLPVPAVSPLRFEHSKTTNLLAMDAFSPLKQDSEFRSAFAPEKESISKNTLVNYSFTDSFSESDENLLVDLSSSIGPIEDKRENINKSSSQKTLDKDFEKNSNMVIDGIQKILKKINDKYAKKKLSTRFEIKIKEVIENIEIKETKLVFPLLNDQASEPSTNIIQINIKVNTGTVSNEVVDDDTKMSFNKDLSFISTKKKFKHTKSSSSNLNEIKKFKAYKCKKDPSVKVSPAKTIVKTPCSDLINTENWWHVHLEDIPSSFFNFESENAKMKKKEKMSDKFNKKNNVPTTNKTKLKETTLDTKLENHVNVIQNSAGNLNLKSSCCSSIKSKKVNSKLTRITQERNGKEDISMNKETQLVTRVSLNRIDHPYLPDKSQNLQPNARNKKKKNTNTTHSTNEFQEKAPQNKTLPHHSKRQKFQP